MTGRIVGEIIPQPDGGGPVFRIVNRESHNAGPNIRPCDHSEFVLDEKWATVTCGKCGERVDAFSALLVFAKWEERWRHQEQMAKEAEKRIHVAELRRLSRLRSVTPDEREEIERLLSRHWSLDPTTLRDAYRKISRNARERKAR